MPRVALLVSVPFDAPGRGRDVDGLKAIITDGDTVAFGSERAVRIMNIDALETRRAHCERELVAGAQRDEALSMLVRSGPVEMERYGQDVYRGHTRPAGRAG